MKIDWLKLAKRIAQSGPVASSTIEQVPISRLVSSSGQTITCVNQGRINNVNDPSVGLLFRELSLRAEVNGSENTWRASIAQLIAPRPVLLDFYEKVSSVVRFQEHEWTLSWRYLEREAGITCSLLAMVIGASVEADGMVISEQIDFLVAARSVRAGYST